MTVQRTTYNETASGLQQENACRLLFEWISISTMAKHLTTEHLQKIGRIGGKTTKRRKGAKFYRSISLMRKSFKGGRPRKVKTEE